MLLVNIFRYKHDLFLFLGCDWMDQFSLRGFGVSLSMMMRIWHKFCWDLWSISIELSFDKSAKARALSIPGPGLRRRVGMRKKGLPSKLCRL